MSIKKIKLPICNKKPERAPHILGKCCILCWRCSMVALNAIVLSILLEFFKIPDYKISYGLCFVLIVPMILDWYYVNKMDTTNGDFLVN